MKNSIAFNRSYVKGLNTTKAESGSSLQTLKSGLYKLLKLPSLPNYQMESLIEAIGELERFHAPKEKRESMTNSEAWIGSACGQHGEQWEQWIQTIRVLRSRVPITTTEQEVIEEQKIMVGSDRKRAHIEWNTGRKEGYIHSHTSRYMNTEDFLETSPEPPNCLMVLPAGYLALDGYTLQTGNLYDNTDDSFRWYDDELTRRWYRILIYEMDDTTYVCAVDACYLRDALSGFDEDHIVTISEKKEGKEEKGMRVLEGSIRIDGSYGGKQRTAVLMTARIDEDKIQTLMGVYNG